MIFRLVKLKMMYLNKIDLTILNWFSSTPFFKFFIICSHPMSTIGELAV